MRLQLKGKRVDITPQLKKLVEARLARLERLLNNSLVSAQMVLSKEKSRFIAELTVHAKGDHIMHGTSGAARWSASLTAAVDKVIQQAGKVKGKWQIRKKGSSSVRKLAVRESRR